MSTFAVVVFPGSNCDHDAYHAVKHVLGQEARFVWHKETSLGDADAVVLPGGFSYGDYLRSGAIARFSPIMGEVARFAAAGGPVLGICNGFQVLLEAGLLPGALMRNVHLEYRCQWTNLRTERIDTSFTTRCSPSQALRIPVSHGEGNYYADDVTLNRLETNGQVLFRYCDDDGLANEAANPNGSARNIAGIINERGNVLGMMPHPERSCEPLLGSDDGNLIFLSLIDNVG